MLRFNGTSSKKSKMDTLRRSVAQTELQTVFHFGDVLRVHTVGIQERGFGRQYVAELSNAGKNFDAVHRDPAPHEIENTHSQPLNLCAAYAHAVLGQNVENPAAVLDGSLHQPLAVLSANVRKHVGRFREAFQQVEAHRHHVVRVSERLVAVMAAPRKHAGESCAFDPGVSARAQKCCHYL
jgi:hypothetical protein